MRNRFIFPCKPRLARFEANYFGNYLKTQLEVTFAVNLPSAKASSKDLNQAGYR